MPEATTGQYNRVTGTRRPVDTGTIFVMKPVPDDDALDKITPGDLQWAADQLRAHVLRYVNAVFDWYNDEIPNGGNSRACIAFVMAEADMSCGGSLSDALGGLLHAADRYMECTDVTNRDCQCGACSYARAMDEDHYVAPDAAERIRGAV